MMKPEGLKEIMKFAQRVEERNLSSRSNRGGSWGSRSTMMGSSQPSLQNGLRGSRMSPLQMEPPIGQPNSTTQASLATTYGSQTIGSYPPRGLRPTHFSPPSQLPSIHSPNPTYVP